MIFEGSKFKINIEIGSNDCFFEHQSFETDSKGYLELKTLLEKLNPSKQVVE